MTCDSSKSLITFEFPYAGLEIRPLSVDSRESYNKLDYVRGTFSKEVSNYIEPYVSMGGNAELREPQPVLLKRSGEKIGRYYFRPEFATFSGDEVTIEFRDVLHFLNSGLVDFKANSMSIENIYKLIIDKRESVDSKIINGVELDTKNGELVLPSEVEASNDNTQNVGGSGVPYAHQKKEMVDFEGITPLKAVSKMNEKFGLDTWVDSEGIFKFGTFEFNTNHHIAAEDDDRVWKMINPNLVKPRNPIKKVVVKGEIVHPYSGSDPEEALLTWLEEKTSKDLPQKEWRTLGIAERENIEFGTEYEFNSKNVSRENLPEIALLKLFQLRRDNETGNITILPNESGEVKSSIDSLQIGDVIQTIPPERCGEGIPNEKYRIVGINHTVEGLEWKINLEVQVATGESATTKLRFLNPRNGNIFTPDKYDTIDEQSDAYWSS